MADQNNDAGNDKLKALNFFVGKWESKGDMKAGPMGPACEVTAEDVYEWLEGGYFLVHHAKISFAGTFTTQYVEYIGYDETTKKYRSHRFSDSPYDEASSTYTGDLIDGKFTISGLSRSTFTVGDEKHLTAHYVLPKDMESRGLDAPESDFVPWMDLKLTRVQ